MFFIFDMQEKWTWNISNNYIIKSDLCIKLKYIWIYLHIYQHISYHLQNQIKKEENNILTIKKKPNAKQMAVSNLYQSAIFKPKLEKWCSDTQAVSDYFCLYSSLVYPSLFEKLHLNCIKEFIL